MNFTEIPKYNMVRIGNPDMINEEVQPWSLDSLVNDRLKNDRIVMDNDEERVLEVISVLF